MNSIRLTRYLKRTLLATGLILFFGVAQAVAEPQQINMQEDWGIAPVHIRVSANGHMIEFRYKVLDTDKALILSDRKDFPSLHAMKSNARLNVPYFPTVGYIKSSRRFIKLGKNYTAMFNNQGRHLISGDKVKIQIRDQVSMEMTLR